MDGLAFGAHEFDELVVADLDELIGRRDLDRLALGLCLDLDGLAERFFFHAGEERFDDAELDVGLEQREPDLAKRGLDVFLVELRETGEPVLRLFESFGERVEHAVRTISTPSMRFHP